MHGYFEQELNAQVYKGPQNFIINGQLFHLAHGDGLCAKEKKYLLMKSVIQHPLSQFIYRQLHPDLGLRLADYFSRLGPKHKYENQVMKKDSQEYQLIYAKDFLSHTPVRYFIFGHRHIPIELSLTEHCIFVNLGDWITFNTYAVFDGLSLQLLKY
jgi:UDP-2,3-diacylglucosamine hydrolase